jgi:hypothetical protein
MPPFGVTCNSEDHSLTELPFLALHKIMRTTVIISQAVFPVTLHDRHCRPIHIKRVSQNVRFQTSILFSQLKSQM